MVAGCAAIGVLALALERRITPGGQRREATPKTAALAPRVASCEDRRVRHVYECPMRWADLDMLGHVNNVVYVDYLQEARVDMLRTHARREAGELTEGVVVVRHEVTYKAPLDVPVPTGQDRVLGHRDPPGHVHDGLRGLPRRR